MGAGRKLVQIYIPYTEWEDWINGMWSGGSDDRLQEAIEFTGNHERYGSAMKEVVEAWPRTMLNSLTNPSINRRAFLGHCAVCYKLGIPERVTRAAWKELTDQQRYDADKVAQETIDEWVKKESERQSNYESRNKPIHQNVGSPLLF